MLWMLLLLTLGLSALWLGAVSAEHAEVSEEEVLARYGLAWQHDDPFAYLMASELAAARLAARTQSLPPARSIDFPVLHGHSR